MYSSVSKGVALLFISSFIVFIPISSAENKSTATDQVDFKVQPQQCVTLRQGRDCFATINIHWKQTNQQSLCLYQVKKNNINQKRQLMCWKKAQQGQARIDFQSSDNLTYQLRTLEDDQLITESEVVVSWLHKNTTRRRRWRLF